MPPTDNKKPLNSFLLKDLDLQQKEVVLTTEGALLVFAGAGSGKTRSIIYRAAYLIKELGVPPWKILIVTFTNKAAKELRERLYVHFSIDFKSFWVGTFHSICAKILRIEANEAQLGFDSNFTIFDTDDTLSLFRKIYKDLNIPKSDYPINKVYSIISRTKSSLVTPGDFFDVHSESKYTKLIHKIYTQYQTRLRDNNSLDFDDLLMVTANLLSENEAVKLKYNNKFDYIMIDEYQDTNYAQFRIVSQLSGDKGNICAVGDDDQAIYSWRGATIKNILNFSSDFSNTKTIRLEQNYRSTQQILDKANTLIACNCTRHPKVLRSDKKDGEEPLLQIYEADKDEVDCVLERAETLFAKNNSEETIVILYRTNAQSRIFETACLERKIPYKIHGSVSFFQRKEIKDIVAYLRVIVNHNDTESFLRIINFPPRGIGQTTVNKLFEYAAINNIPLYDTARQADNTGILNQSTANKVFLFTNQIEKWRQMAQEAEITELLEDIYGTLKLFTYYQNSSDYKDTIRLENITEFLAAATEYCDNYKAETGEEPHLADFLQNISLLTNVDNEYQGEENNRGRILNLMTLHNAKGLEFDNVFIVGLEERLLPHQLSIDSEEEIEEERRLLYVGMTRAKKRLYLSYAKYRRSFYGYEPTYPSRFVREIFPEFDRYKKGLKNQGNKRTNVTEVKKIGSYTIEEPAYRIGQRVVHNDFGEGTILNVDGKGKDARLTINFDACSLKKVVGSYIKTLTD